MVGVYFSGTGNTKHCIERFLSGMESGAEMFALENPQAVEAVKGVDEIVFAYPVYYSNLPKIVRDFITNNAELWRDKRIFIIATMGAFSGDGAGCAARLFKKFGARVTGGLHLKMPDCIGDVKLLKKPFDKNRELINKADEKIDGAVAGIKRGKYMRNGLGMFAHIAGLFGQRLYFSGKTKKYFSGVKADGEKCVGCGICAGVCPMQNIKIEDGKANFNGKCTMCYRCFSDCPKQAITIIGKRVYEQSKYEKYLTGGKIENNKEKYENNSTLKKVCDELEIYKYAFNNEDFYSENLPDHKKLPHSEHDPYVEAVIGVIYLDRGFDYTNKWIEENLLPRFKEAVN